MKNLFLSIALIASFSFWACSEDDDSGTTSNNSNSTTSGCVGNITELNQNMNSALNTYLATPTSKTCTDYVSTAETYWNAFKNCPGYTQQAHDAALQSINQAKAACQGLN